MDLNVSVFQEPRGVMRILHFVFSICAFATLTSFSGYMTFTCDGVHSGEYKFGYPFDLHYDGNLTQKCTVRLEDFSSDAEFFLTTGVLAMIYSVLIIFVYIKLDEMYKANPKIPLYDFAATVVFAILWLSSSAAWANSLDGLKYVMMHGLEGDCTGCSIKFGSFSTLNISVVFGFLNFFLWAADLWFLYKETTWFQGNQPQGTSGV